MSSRIYRRFVITFLLFGLLAGAIWAAEGPAGGLSRFSRSENGTVPLSPPNKSWQTITVTKTYNNVSFPYQIKFHAQRNGYRVFQVRYPSPVTTPFEQNNSVPAEYYLPDGFTPGDCPDFRLSENGTVPLLPPGAGGLP